MVRNGGTKAHQGWDLVAAPMTPCGKIKRVGLSTSYGNYIEFEFVHNTSEIRTQSGLSSPGLVGRVDPARLYGFTPQSSTIFQEPAKGGTTGMKVPGINVQERPE